LPFRAGGVSLTLFVCDPNQRLESFGYIVFHQFLETVGLMRLQWKSVESVSSEVVRVHATYSLESCDGYYQCSDNHTEDFVTILYRHSRHLAPLKKSITSASQAPHFSSRIKMGVTLIFCCE
jgi:hypothetical protein